METKLIQGDYKEFRGRYNAQMPLLVQEGLQPLTSKDLMQYRLQAIQGKNKDEISFWLDRYFDTVTGLAYHNDELIIDPNSQLLISITPESKLNNGSLILDLEQYKELAKQHGVIKRKDIISGRDLTRKEAKDSEIWYELAGKDAKLHHDYTDAIFDEAKSRYDYDKNMGIYLPNDQKNPAMRDWYLRNLGNRSRADARYNLRSGSGLLGVRTQNLGSLLEQIANEEGIKNPQDIRRALKLYKTTKELLQ